MLIHWLDNLNKTKSAVYYYYSRKYTVYFHSNWLPESYESYEEWYSLTNYLKDLKKNEIKSDYLTFTHVKAKRIL